MKFCIAFISFSFILFAVSCSGKPKPATPRVTIAKAHKAVPHYAYVDDFEKTVNDILSETHIPGAAIAIVKDSDVVFLKGYGVKKFGTNDSVDIHTVFRIASVSKGFASMLAGILVQEKSIQWDDKVVKYLPKFKLSSAQATNELTIRHILSHTSGLPVHAFTNEIERNVPYDVLRDKLNTLETSNPVGKVFAYQNVAYSLISDIAQAATKKTYETLLREKIFVPLDMGDASASFDAIKSANNLALPHIRRSANAYKTIENTPEYYTVLPAAGVNASISDMSKWLLALLGDRPRVINNNTLGDMFRPEIITPRMRKYEFFHWPYVKNASYGLGWRILNYHGDTLIYHGGHVNGYRSEVAFCPAQHVGIVILTNSRGKLANDGVELFFDAYFAAEKKAKRS